MLKRRGVLLTIFVLAGFFVACSSTPKDPAAKKEAISELIKEKIIHEGEQPVHSFLLYVEHQPSGFLYHEGFGLVDGQNEEVSKDASFKIASITKTFVATVVLQLMEEDKLTLDDFASEYLDGLDYLRFDSVHVMNGTSYADDITIRHLITNRSGISDIFTDAQERFNNSVLENPTLTFTVPSIVERYYEYDLNTQPHFKPGEGYHYSDMNFLLLGLIIEQVTGESLPQQIRKRILEPLEMDNTYFEYYEPETGTARQAHVFLGSLDATQNLNTSYEWGGGLVSTTEKLAVFIQALFNNELYSRPETLDLMLEPALEEGSSYGMGITRYDIQGENYFGHGGFWGSLLIYSPESKVTFSTSANQSDYAFDPLRFVVNTIEIAKN